MFKKLLVPLDGSALAETVLPAAAFLARKFKASVTLFHVIEHHPPRKIHGDRHLSDAKDARAYLNLQRRQAFSAESTAFQHVHSDATSDVAGAIVAHAKELSSDLIIMCTHGSGGFKGILFGRIAQRVIASGSTPVLIINPAKKWEVPEQGGCLLVPLDGETKHEQGLPAAVELARACEASLHLLRVVPTFKTLKVEQAATGRLAPGSTAAMLELAEEEAVAYLEQKAAALKEAGIGQPTLEVLRGEPAKTIIKTSKRAKADLIVLGTHGKSGTDAFWSGSVAPRVCVGWKLPILLVPVTH